MDASGGVIVHESSGIQSLKVTLDLDFWKHKALQDALSEYHRVWLGMIRDCEEGKRPNMSLEGAYMIFDDIVDLMKVVSTVEDK